jgi:hypothetical protein
MKLSPMFTLNVLFCYHQLHKRFYIVSSICTIQNILISFVLVGFEAVILKVAQFNLHIFICNKRITNFEILASVV